MHRSCSSSNSELASTTAPPSAANRFRMPWIAERPTVSTPLEWDEVEAAADRGDADLLVFEADDVVKRVESRGDLFSAAVELEQALPKPPG